MWKIQWNPCWGRVLEVRESADKKKEAASIEKLAAFDLRPLLLL
jgi:hypothetical protein